MISAEEKRITLTLIAQQQEMTVNPVNNFRGPQGEKGDPGTLTGIAEDSLKLGGVDAAAYLTAQQAAETYLAQETANETYLGKTEQAKDSLKLGGLLPADFVQVANGRETLGIKATKVLDEALFAVGAEIPFTESLGNFDFLVAKINYKVSNLAMFYGWPQNFELTAVDAVTSETDSPIRMCSIFLGGISGSNSKTFVSYRRITFNMDGSISTFYGTPTSGTIRIGPAYGIKLIK